MALDSGSPCRSDGLLAKMRIAVSQAALLSYAETGIAV